ncbi:response regulator [Pseudobacteriovorax antillogorgiicola]|uniref:Response regulator receiver domain-containing protein n=1 Tax=Pseudobacteriovorax antillogorgiicola TaxID=1513793 RepID=A0A1Y6C475_9BACT|nr:response regulator [Pseudobacteriovorax antillogorgiicola]TCS49888.1 response regulator receiver domain-containing protein [Pseudobacteriovorax antillogorgiicola]SMF44633.1 Response regulator receiver domain-containing protein [Pseudobacteriovorax antillogorgiicola]
MKVLIADDEPEIIDLIVELLPSGSLPRIVHDGFEALTICQKERFDIIISDYNMPHMNGYQFVKKLREGSSRNRDTPVMMISGYLAAAQKKSEHLSDITFFDKPLDFDRFEAFIDKFQAEHDPVETHLELMVSQSRIKKCLVIDDDPEILILICDIMKEHDFIAQSCESASDALALGIKMLEDFDLIISDLKMPQMDGFELTAKLHKFGVYTPIIGVTGLDDEGEELFKQDDKRTRSKPDFILKKPFRYQDIEELKDKLGFGSPELKKPA